MQATNFRFLINGTTYEEIIEKTEEKISSFTKIEKEDIVKKFNIEYNIFEAHSDGISDPTYSAEVFARMRNNG